MDSEVTIDLVPATIHWSKLNKFPMMYRFIGFSPVQYFLEKIECFDLIYIKPLTGESIDLISWKSPRKIRTDQTVVTGTFITVHQDLCSIKELRYSSHRRKINNPHIEQIQIIVDLCVKPSHIMVIRKYYKIIWVSI